MDSAHQYTSTEVDKFVVQVRDILCLISGHRFSFGAAYLQKKFIADQPNEVCTRNRRPCEFLVSFQYTRIVLRQSFMAVTRLRVPDVQLRSLHGGKSYASHGTKPKPNPPNHNSKTIHTHRFSKFNQINKPTPQRRRNDAMFPNTLYIRDFTGHQPALAVTDFPTFSTILCLLVGFSECSECDSMSGSRRVVTVMFYTVLNQ